MSLKIEERGGDMAPTSMLQDAGENQTATGNDGQTEEGGNQTDQDGGIRMEKNVGLVSGVALIVGTIIGSGIFISPKGVMEGSGSVGMTLLLWLACGILSTMGALVYAELGTAVPRSGGEHAYLLYTYATADPATGTPRGWGRAPAFLFDWMGLLIIRPTMFALISLALGTYIAKPLFPTCDAPPVAVKLITFCAMCMISFLNCWSVRMATSVQNVCTFTKVTALFIVAVGGVVQLARGETENFAEPFADTSTSPGTLAIALYNGLWAFDGWNSLNFVTEELKNPSRNLPLAIMLGIPLTTLCYVMANVGYVTVMCKAEILQSRAVAVRWGEVMFGPDLSWLMPCFVIVSTLGAANGCLFASCRLSYVAGREGYFPKVLGYISVRRLTPVPAILFTLAVATCLVIPSDLGILIDIFIFSSWLFYGWTTVSLLILRWKDPHLHRPYKVPLAVPVLMCLACLFLLLTPIIQNPAGSGSVTLLILVLGLVAYLPFIHWHLKLPGVDHMTAVLQKLLHVVPTHRD